MQQEGTFLTFFPINNKQSSRTKLSFAVCTVVYNYYNHNKNSTFVSPVYTSPLAGNIIVYTPSHGANREKYFNHNNNEDKNAYSGGK